MKKNLFVFFSLMAIFVFASSISAQPGFNRKAKGFGHQALFGCFYGLELTAEQTKSINEIKLEFEKKAVDIRANIEKERINKREIRTSKNIDKSKFLTSEKKLGELRNELRLLAAEYWLKGYDVLTDEQKEKVGICNFDGKSPMREKKFKYKMFNQ